MIRTVPVTHTHLVVARLTVLIDSVKKEFKGFSSFPGISLKCPEEFREEGKEAGLTRPLTTIQHEALYQIKEDIEKIKTKIHRYVSFDQWCE